jgi:nitroreductase
MKGPGPSPEQLRKILSAAARAPDHGKLFPWRFILFEGEARAAIGDLLADCIKESEPQASEERVALERGRFLRAPVVVGVVSRVRESIPIPEWEQVLSAGAVCENMLIATHAEGLVASWITEWYAYHPRVKDRLGLKSGERIAGFIYIGTSAQTLEERVRPDLDALITHFRG